MNSDLKEIKKALKAKLDESEEMLADETHTPALMIGIIVNLQSMIQETIDYIEEITYE
jgi:hypothetical protein